VPKGMFTELMEASDKKQKPPVEQEARVASPTPPPTDLLPDSLEDLSTVGYNSHSYRFTETEIRWMRRFSLRASELLDRKISHNSLVRVLLRLADQEWKTDPDRNRLRDILSKLKD
jgi:hypothetical protein